MQGDLLLLIGLVGLVIVFIAVGALLYFYGWRFLTFRLIGGTVAKLLGGRYQPESEEHGEIVPPPHLDSQTAIQQLPDFHATVAQYRNQDKLTADQWQGVDEAESDVEFTADPDSNARKGEYGVRYSRSSPNRLLRDRRYKRVRGPDSGHDPEVHDGMFKEK
jgi:hypothetical protein